MIGNEDEGGRFIRFCGTAVKWCGGMLLCRVSGVSCRNVDTTGLNVNSKDISSDPSVFPLCFPAFHDRIILILLNLLTLVSIMNCSTYSRCSDNNLLYLIEELENHDILWDGNMFGLEAHVQGKTAKRIANCSDHAISLLLLKLDDPNKFVAAHVLLTYMCMNEFEYDQNHWNRLVVTMSNSGTVYIDESQIPYIQKYWEDMLD